MEPLRAGKPCELILKFTNPTQHQTVISILEMNFDEMKPPGKEEPVASIAEDLEQKLSVQEVSKLSVFKDFLSHSTIIWLSKIQYLT